MEDHRHLQKEDIEEVAGYDGGGVCCWGLRLI